MRIGIRYLLTIAMMFVCGLVGHAEEKAPAQSKGDITLTGDTNKPELSVFGENEAVQLTFNATNLQPGQTGLTLHLSFADEHEAVLETKEIPVTADAGGKWSTTFDAPRPHLGFYRVYAKLSNGVTIKGRKQPKEYISRPDGYITYAIVPDPSKREEYPPEETFFGMQGGYSAMVNVFPYLGIRWVMGPYGNWGSLCPEQHDQFPQLREKALKEGKKYPNPGYNWPVVKGKDGSLMPWKLYRWFSNISAAGSKWKINPYVLETYTHSTGRLTPEGEKLFADYCKVMSQAAVADFPNQPRFYEVTWEPCYPWGFKGTDEDLVKIYEVAYKALHEGDPQAIVSGPCEASIDSVARYETLKQKGLFKYLDAFSQHPYIGLPPEQNNLREKIVGFKEWMRTSLGKELPMCGTEQGYSTGEQMEREIIQARGLVRANLIHLGEGWRLNFAFYAVDYGNPTETECGYGFHYNLHPTANFGTPKWGPKPVSPAYAAMTFLLEGHKSTACLDWLGGTALGYVYERGDDLVVAVWDWVEPAPGESARTVSLPAGVDEVIVYDWMGNPQNVKTVGGMLKLQLKPEPVYVKGLSAKLWGSKAVKPVTTTQREYSVYPGGRLHLPVTVSANLGGDLSAKLTLDADESIGLTRQEKEISLKDGGNQVVGFEFTISPTLPTGSYPLSLALGKDGQMIGGAACLLRVLPPLTLDRLCPVFANENGSRTPGLLLTLREEEKTQTVGALSLKLGGVPESTQQVALALAPGEKKVYTLHYPAALDVSPLRSYDAQITLQTEKGYRLKQTQPVNFTYAPRLAVAPAVDGDLAEWQNVPGAKIGGREWVTENVERYRGADDLSATIRYAWDEQNLYFAAEVDDNAFNQPFTGWSTWQGDCIQLAIDLDYGKSVKLTGNELVDKDIRRRHTETDLALTAKGPEAFRTTTFSREKLPDNTLIPAAQVKLAIRKIEKPDGGVRVVYEAAIAWSALGADKAPVANSLIGIAGTVNDKDKDDKSYGARLGWFVLKKPDRFGGLYLGGK